MTFKSDTALLDALMPNRRTEDPGKVNQLPELAREDAEWVYELADEFSDTREMLPADGYVIQQVGPEVESFEGRFKRAIPNASDILGKTIGDLLVLRVAPRQVWKGPHAEYRCKNTKTGKFVTIRGDNLRRSMRIHTR